MKITVNGTEETVTRGRLLSELLSQKQLDPARIVIEHNGRIIKRDSTSDIILQDNDILEILHFVGGG